MKVEARVKDVVSKVYDGEIPTATDIRHLLKIEPHSLEAGFILSAADNLNRIASQNQAEVHAQIGINCAPCSRNCSFCAFAARNKVFQDCPELGFETALHMARKSQTNAHNF
ncbi:hypothetical protein ACFL27_05200 [candidate division CSSED10-310 bacterium]|uniref:Biotin synthase BioB n=1 Tax=candidate division CSSED10-310 bacterium TaxID=2855610 RepID=A0ABV6YTS7_UNCC1